jgi:hypothetical protein
VIAQGEMQAIEVHGPRRRPDHPEELADLFGLSAKRDVIQLTTAADEKLVAGNLTRPDPFPAVTVPLTCGSRRTLDVAAVAGSFPSAIPDLQRCLPVEPTCLLRSALVGRMWLTKTNQEHRV